MGGSRGGPGKLFVESAADGLVKAESHHSLRTPKLEEVPNCWKALTYQRELLAASYRE